MARPQKFRCICSKPATTRFEPAGEKAGEPVYLGYDEYETVRLLDYELFSQEQCARRMGVSRPTVTRMYDAARRKIAAALIDGRPLEISGGDVIVCPAMKAECKDMPHCCHRQRGEEEKERQDRMKIAVTYENGMIFQHFGHSEQFKIYTAEAGKVVKAEVLPVSGGGHGALAGFLQGLGVDALICGGIGGGAKQALAQAGIRLYCGAAGEADKAVGDLLEGRLAYNEDIVCAHHHHEDGEHSCGSHGCHEGHCGH
ncbi:MAG: DUF134 domain-containing protein [Oscillospiraceae bacterium]|nr:DUF134 domain-containing protein [Oscillospiraceae bacterium]